MDKEYYDLCYENWRSGGSMDEPSPDDYDTYLSQGYEPEEIPLPIERHLRAMELLDEDNYDTC